jgi:hypothetical protein
VLKFKNKFGSLRVYIQFSGCQHGAMKMALEDEVITWFPGAWARNIPSKSSILRKNGVINIYIMVSADFTSVCR